jgi:hypothetical protein
MEYMEPEDIIPQQFHVAHQNSISPVQFHTTTYVPCTSKYPLDMYLVDDDDENDNKKNTEVTTEVILAIRVNDEDRLFRALLDSGTSRSLITHKAVVRAQLEETPNSTAKQPNCLTRYTYHTTVGTFSTTSHTTIRRHRILDLSGKRQLANLKAQIHDGDLGQYDLILGRDYM